MGIFNFPIPQDEKTLFLAKIHWASYVYTWLKILLSGLVLGLALTFILPFWWENRWGRIGFIIFISGAVGYILYDSWKKFLTSYIITQCRLIDVTQEKFFRRVITEINTEEVDEAIVKQDSWWDKLFKKGNVIIKLNGQEGVLVFYDIKNPETVQNILEGIKKETREIVSKKGKECNIIMRDSKARHVPLSYSYYGDKKRRMKKKNGSLIVVEKKKEEKEK